MKIPILKFRFEIIFGVVARFMRLPIKKISSALYAKIGVGGVFKSALSADGFLNFVFNGKAFSASFAEGGALFIKGFTVTATSGVVHILSFL